MSEPCNRQTHKNPQVSTSKVAIQMAVNITAIPGIYSIVTMSQEPSLLTENSLKFFFSRNSHHPAKPGNIVRSLAAFTDGRFWTALLNWASVFPKRFSLLTWQLDANGRLQETRLTVPEGNGYLRCPDFEGESWGDRKGKRERPPAD